MTVTDYVFARTHDELKEGYATITGLDNVEEFTEDELRQYMADALREDKD